MSAEMGIGGYIWGQWPHFSPLSSSPVDDGRRTGGNATHVGGLCIQDATLFMQWLPICQECTRHDTMAMRRQPTFEACQGFHADA